MLTVLVFGVLVGLDNLQLASALGLMGLDRRYRWAMVIAFSVFEMGMPLVGLLMGHALNQQVTAMVTWIGPCLLLLIGLVIVVRAVMEKEQAPLVQSNWLLFLLPLTMSFDNLAAGVGLGAVGYPIWTTALCVGLCAGSMCFIGLFVGERLRRWIPRRVELISGLYLVILAVVGLIDELQ